MRDDTSEEELRLVLGKLVLKIGRQVTDAYKWKHGLWEGMSVENVKSINETIPVLRSFIEQHGLEQRLDEVAKMPISGSMGVIYRYKRDRRAALTAVKKATATSNGVKGDES